MKKEVRVWKVLRKATRTSAMTPYDLQLHYPVGKFVKPKVGKIFCFKSKEFAERFIAARLVFARPFSCHKSIAINPSLIYCVSSINDAKYSKKFWKGKLSASLQSHPPMGTLVCDALKCID